ncbi:hypothetical protein B0H10DRAFT_2216870 [Mycena sp. CBHHK59/15]|nr:hypothetical protein B0H10DRAFT_2216870 [Mycena sp. CBHHK59/15]
MDIKFIGSGPAAKAVLYYITDYITKTQLQAHVAYAALELAVGRLGEYDPDTDEHKTRAKRLLQKCAHSMIAKQELSAQQVASYLMDFEDHYTSHKFNNLYWTSFEKFINEEEPSPECYRPKDVSPEQLDPEDNVGSTPLVTPPEPCLDADEEDDGTDASFHLQQDASSSGEDEITLVFDSAGRIKPTANQVSDYQNRGSLLDNICVWEFAARIEKVSKSSAKRKHKRPSEEGENEEQEDETNDLEDFIVVDETEAVAAPSADDNP